MLFIVKTIIQWRKFILAAGILTAGVAAVVSLMLPKWYTAATSVFPPETGGMTSGYVALLEQSLQLPIAGPSATGSRSATIYIDIMLSRRIGSQIVDEFNLKEVFGKPLMSDAVMTLRARSTFRLMTNGLLKITYESQDAERAAAIANRYVELLDEFNRELNVTTASKTKEFTSRQIEIHAKELRDAEEALKRFQQENETLKLDEQITSAIDIVASLTAEAVAKEVELEILREYTSQSSEEFIRKKKEYDEVLDQLRMFKADSARTEPDLIRSFFPTFDTIPELALELARLTRRVKIEEAVYGLLVKEFAKSRIEEARDTPTVQVLDKAAVPELRSRPKRKLLVVIGGVVGIAWSSLFAVFLAVWREDKRRTGAVIELLAPITSDVRTLFRFGKKS